MSFPNVDPAVTTTNPVAQQAVTAGNQLHEDALRGSIDPSALNAAVAQAFQDQFAVTQWKRKPQIQFVIECPSGQRCLAKHLNTMDLVDADLIEEVDFFTKRLFPSAFDAAGNPVDSNEEDTGNESFWGTLKDPEKKVRFFRLLNRLLAIGVVKPHVVDDGVDVVVDESGNKTVQYGANARPLREGEVYASDIDFADKITIFGELNKPLEQIKPFREESSTVLPSVPASEGVTG